MFCLAVGIDEPLSVQTDRATTVARTVLIPPRVRHQLTVQGRLVSCYLDPASARTASCRELFTDTDGIGVRHRAEGALLNVPAGDIAALRWLDTAAPTQVQRMDPRIELVAKQIRDDPTHVESAGDLAAAVGLSESRFLHLFRQETGSSLRRYRLWSRLTRAGAEIAAGQSLTVAAVEAGFTSPSHLSDRFKSTFGLSATALLATGLTIRTP
ncbi:helix-turn-helix domain-containing protein [Mycolicibacterium llatzerense]